VSLGGSEPGASWALTGLPGKAVKLWLNNIEALGLEMMALIAIYVHKAPGVPMSQP